MAICDPFKRTNHKELVKGAHQRSTYRISKRPIGVPTKKPPHRCGTLVSNHRSSAIANASYRQKPQ